MTTEQMFRRHQRADHLLRAVAAFDAQHGGTAQMRTNTTTVTTAPVAVTNAAPTPPSILLPPSDNRSAQLRAQAQRSDAFDQEVVRLNILAARKAGLIAPPTPAILLAKAK